MPPTNPGPTDEVRPSHKRKAPLDANSDPVNMNPAKKKKASVGSTTPALPKKKSVSEKPVPARRQPSVEMEDMPDDSERFRSEVPHNPQNILEAADNNTELSNVSVII